MRTPTAPPAHTTCQPHTPTRRQPACTRPLRHACGTDLAAPPPPALRAPPCFSRSRGACAAAAHSRCVAQPAWWPSHSLAKPTGRYTASQAFKALAAASTRASWWTWSRRSRPPCPWWAPAKGQAQTCVGAHQGRHNGVCTHQGRCATAVRHRHMVQVVVGTCATAPPTHVDFAPHGVVALKLCGVTVDLLC